jgi:beta-lactamase class D
MKAGRSKYIAPCILFLCGCAGTPVALGLHGSACSERIRCGPVSHVDAEGSSFFSQAGVEGAFVVMRERDQVITVVNPEIAQRGFLPASTFKIANTLIGLETGVIPDEQFSLRWDGIHREGPKEWDRDHVLQSALMFSVVWFYQEIARRIGAERMQAELNAFNYGNHNIEGGIDSFWLTGGLRISPREQVDFLHRLHVGSLPVAPEHVALVERLTVLDARVGTVLRGKTGLTLQDGVRVAWLVGSVTDARGEFYEYAMLILAKPENDAQTLPLRRSLTRKLLVRSGILPSEMIDEP